MSLSFPLLEVTPTEFPAPLKEVPQPPKNLNYRGELPPPSLTLLTVVGSRNYTTYGKQVVDHLIGGLKGYEVGIVSGLALGIDSLAHEAALKNNLYTLAVPGSGISDGAIYPASHRPLARKILEHGGGLLSEFAPDFKGAQWSFAQRNRIMAGLSRATLIVEASEKSGTLITARMATDYNRELLIVPGNIFSQNSAGPHQFLKLGATPVTCAEDILYVLGFSQEEIEKKSNRQLPLTSLSIDEERVLAQLKEPTEKDVLIRTLLLPSHTANALLMQMEMKGLIHEEQGIYRKHI